MPDTHKNSMRAVILAIIIGLVGMCYFTSFANYGINLEDEGTILYQIERTADGQSMYTDFHVGYTPVMYYFNAAVLRACNYNIVKLRWVLAAVNSLSMFFLVLLAARFAPLWLAWIPALFYMTSIPVHPGEFAAFNIPYPAWYNVLFFVSGLLASLQFAISGRLRWLALAGFLAGLNFSFKPNAGLFHIASAALGMLAVVPITPNIPPGWRKRLSRLTWWILWAGTILGTWAVFAGKVGSPEIWIYLMPVSVMALVVVWRSSLSAAEAEYPGVIACTATLLGTFLIVVLPWMVLVIDKIGLDRFLVNVLFLGANFEKFYYIAHPPVRSMVGAGLMLLSALLLYPRLVKRRWLRPQWICLAALLLGPVVGAVFLSHAQMPEGFFNAVNSALESKVFPFALVVHWTFLFLTMLTISPEPKDSARSARYCIAGLGGLFMYLQLYPRTDYMHWVTAAPLSLVLAVGVAAIALAKWSNGAPRWGRVAISLIFAAPFAALVAVRLTAAASTIVELSPQGVSWVASTSLNNSRARLWINIGRERRYKNLETVVKFFQDNTPQSEEIFTFPSLDIVSFLSNRNNPTRHGYFFPRWPGHAWEAEVVADLMVKRPRFAVVLHDHAPFFSQAPIYYFAISEYLERNYRPYHKIGPYQILLRSDLTLPKTVAATTALEAVTVQPDGQAPTWLLTGMASKDANVRLATLDRACSLYIETQIHSVTDALLDDDARVRNMVVWALRYSRDPKIGNALARALRRDLISGRERIIAGETIQRALGGAGVRSLIAFVQSDFGRVGNDARDALYFASTRYLASSFWVGFKRQADPALISIAESKSAIRILKEWLRNPSEDGRLRRVAIWLSRYLPADEFTEDLQTFASGDNLGLKVLAYYELIDRGLPTRVEDIPTGLVNFDDMLAPRAIMKAMSSPRLGDRSLADALVWSGDGGKRTAGWIAALRGGRRALKAIKTNLGSGDPDLRKSAIWALQRRGRSEMLEQIKMLQFDQDFEVREFADRAVAYLTSPGNTAP